MSWKTGTGIACLLVLMVIPANAAKIEFVPVTASGAHAIRGREIVLVGGGQEVTLEVRISSWTPYLLRGYQVQLDMAGFESGDAGTVFPLGWDRDYDFRGCLDDWDCPGEQVCHTQWNRCAGPGHSPELGWFIDIFRTDYVFHEVPSMNSSVGMLVDLAEYRLADVVTGPGAEPEYSPPPKYAGTLILAVSEDAAGTFMIGFYEEGGATSLIAPRYEQIEPLIIRGAFITVTEPGCGNSICELGENCANCSDDCGRVPHLRELVGEVKSASPEGNDGERTDMTKPERRARVAEPE